MSPRTDRLPFRSALAIAAAALLLGAQAPPASPAPPDAPTAEAPSAPLVLPTMKEVAPRDYPGIVNVVAFGPDFYSGAAPEGDLGFDTLRALGIRTIISVDGARPEVDKATARGMRYVHLPIGYGGFDEARKLEITKAVRDLEKPVYLHCHHGKHRSAGAAATVSVGLGWSSNEDAIARMRLAGTAPDYKGLYECAGAASVVGQALLDSVRSDFPSVARTSGLVQTMVAIEEAHDHLRAIEKAGWQVPADHPDLVPVAEAGRLADLLRTLGDDAEAKAKSEEFRARLAADAADAQALEDLLLSKARSEEDLTKRFAAISRSCKDCHAKYRD